MKNFILNFKAGIRFFTSIIISREFAVIYCLLGTISQISHTYFLIESISSLDGMWRSIQATMLSIFISSSLFYFVAIADKDSDDYDEQKRINLAINLFTFMEIIINIYYYTRHLLIDQKEYQTLDYIFAILVSCLIPITIKLYSSSIRAKEWIISIENDKKAFIVDIETNLDLDSDSKSELNIETIKPIIESFQEELKNLQSFDENKLNDLFLTKEKEMEEKITETFNKNQNLFLNQFENKLKLITKNYENNI